MRMCLELDENVRVVSVRDATGMRWNKWMDEEEGMDAVEVGEMEVL